MSFQELGLREDLLRAVSDQGYTEPTPIQRQAIPTILEGGDVLAGAQTGTGKTAGFTLPLLQRLMEARPAPEPTAAACAQCAHWCWRRPVNSRPRCRRASTPTANTCR
jgi:superfamily II DNA/RNA helicase